MSDFRVWQGTRAVSAPAADDRGLCYGDGLFETVAVIAGRAVLLAAHWQRLEQGCVRLGIPVLAFWHDAVADFLSGRDDGVLRIQVTRGAGGRGYLPPDDAQPTLILGWHAPAAHPPALAGDGIRLGDCTLRLGCQPALAGLKHGNRLEQVLLRRELASLPACAEALVLAADGTLAEGVFSNLFLVRDDVLMTPALTRCGVHGVLRGALLEAAAAAGLRCRLADLREADLAAADEVFMTNSLFGIWPVTAWRDRAWRPGRITRQCQALIAPWFASA